MFEKNVRVCSMFDKTVFNTSLPFQSVRTLPYDSYLVLCPSKIPKTQNIQYSARQTAGEEEKMKFLSPQFPVTAAQGRNDMMTFSDDWVVASSTTQQSMDEGACREVNGPQFLIKLDGQCGKNVIGDNHTCLLILLNIVF